MDRPKNALVPISIIIAVLLLSGCHALSRGDVGRHVDDELAFARIGFLMTDGANGSFLYRNAVTVVRSTDTDIDITIPYFVDQAGTTVLIPQAGSELTLTFETVAKDALVYDISDAGYTTPLNPGDPATAQYAFHDGTSPVSQSLVIRKVDPSTGNESTRTFTINVRKEFYPVVELIDNPNFAAPPDMPAAIAVHFEDELGNIVPLGTPQDGFTGSTDEIWLDDGDGIDENPTRKDITADFSSWNTGLVADTGLAMARPLAQGDFRLTVPDETSGQFYFVDQYGYQNSLKNDRTFDAVWDPDAVYMAPAAAGGNDGNTGLSASDPVLTLGQAFTVASGASRWEIRAAEGNYDLGTGVLITGNISIYGGYRTDFSSRYDMESADTRAAHGSRFFAIPTGGGDVNSIEGVLTYDPGAGTINDSSILDGIVIAAATEAEGGQDFTTALEIIGDASPLVRYCTLAGGGGPSRQGISGVTLTDVTGSPEFRWNVVSAARTATDGDNAGIYAVGAATYLIGSGNAVAGADSANGSSYGVRLENANAELHFNDIQAGSAAAGAASAGISAFGPGSWFVLLNGNLIAAADSGGGSYGIEFDGTQAQAHVFKNRIRSADGDVSAGVYTANITGMEIFEVLNNAFLVGSGATESRGFSLGNANPAEVFFVNNLVDSADPGLIGFASQINVAGDTNCLVHNNAFDDASWPVDMVVDGSTEDLFGAQDNHANLTGNIAKSFSFDADGRITSGMDANLAYGGLDASGYSAEAGSFNVYARDDYYRSLDFPNCGWSIGPYEFDNPAYPTAVHVATGGSSNPGSDEYALGTAQYPFASIQTAHDAIAARSPIVGAMELRVAEGTYSITTAVSITADMTFTGGWNQTFGSRSNTPYSTILMGTGSAILAITDVSDAFSMEGFTFQSLTGGSSAMVSLSASTVLFTAPEIRYNTFDGTAGAPTDSLLLDIDGTFTPTIRNNTFIGAPTSLGDSVGIRTTGSSYPNIYRNTITGGTPTGSSIGILTGGSAYPNIYENTISGGAPIGGDALGLRLADCGYATVRNNDIDGGAPVAGDTVMMEISGASSLPFIRYNDMDGPSSGDGSLTGISVLAGADPVIEGNYIFTGNTNNGHIHGILAMDAGTDPQILNNVVTAGSDGGSNSYEVIGVANDAAPLIQGNTVNGGFSLDCYGISVNSTNPVTIDGNAINLAGGSYLYGISLQNGAHIVSNNTLNGGNATDELYGLRLNAADGSYVNNNAINLGTGNRIAGILLQTSSGCTIENNDIAGGTATGANDAIYFDASSGNNATGNTIVLGDGLTTAGVTMDSSTGCTLESNVISGGTATTSLYGIRLSNSPNATVRGCDIDLGGNAGLPISFGLNTLACSGLTVEYNSIAGGTGINAYGVNIQNGTVIYVTDNTITGTSVGSTTTIISTGLYLTGTDQTMVLRNFVHAGEATDVSRGIDVDVPNVTCITNNLVHGGGLVTGLTTGIRVVDGDDTGVLYNNTVYGGRSSGGMTVGVHLTGTARPRIVNNLVIAGSGAAENNGIRQESTLFPAAFETNAIIGTDPSAAAYRDDGGTLYSTSNEIDTYFGGPPYVAVAMADYDANLTAEHPSAYLVDFTANGGITAFLNDDWRLSGGGQQDAVSGGTDLSAYPAPYGFADDRDGAARTAPWSVGAYEY